MPRVRTRINHFYCGYACNCFNCGTDLYHKYCIGKRKQNRYCIPCAFLKRIVIRKDCDEFNIEFPLGFFLELYQTGKLSRSQLRDYGVKDSEVMILA